MAKACGTVSEQLQAKIDEWLRWDKNPKTSLAIKQLFEENKFDQLSKVLLNRLKFGTAGLRGKMSAGYACMNDLVIVQTGQGYLKYLEKYRSDLLKRNGIVVGYDGRHNSKKWAEITATIFANAGYKVRITNVVHPTPLVPFTVKTYNLAGGVMVTASHNPKDDNGYKVYDANSAQIISPEDQRIQDLILDNLVPQESSWDTSVLQGNPLIIDHLPEITELYLKQVILDQIHPDDIDNNAKVGLNYVYTALHGVGWAMAEKVALKVKGNLFPVPEQQDPHPDFPTVKFPNPEEGKSALDLSFKYADEKGCSIILANDPDADRFAVAEKNKISGEWRIFNGNELGSLLGWWMLQSHKRTNPQIPLDKVYMISSTVSSMILQTMAKAEGFNFVDTLTGCKWIGNKCLQLEREGFKVIFCFEEAIGYMCNDIILDKDGISALANFICLSSFVYGNNKQLCDQLDEIYDKYGFHLSLNSYYFCHEPKVINQIFERIRNLNGPKKYPTGILNEKFKITAVRDLTTGYDNAQPDNRAVLPVSCESQMITFTFENGLHITIRTSGTEPKIKYYSELCTSPDVKDKSVALATLQEMVNAICKEFLEPDKNGLEPQNAK
ncbi:phosphopentomutase [Anthonomus grandis grandis]|uniref:phosphopentomutase n=1 Tax=Anthonomus grandis grandis TaxID=2921223 RepID=UPI002165A6A3|nr:phosphopentomutase [Anthonomus grandis grandis]